MKSNCVLWKQAMEFQISYYSSLGSCFALSILYVSRWENRLKLREHSLDISFSIYLFSSYNLYLNSLYVWSSKENRDHPSTIKKRFFSVFIVMLLSPFFVCFFSSQELFKHFNIWTVMGLRIQGFFSALFIPLILTMVLFLGPLSVQLTNGIWKIYSGMQWRHVSL